MVFLEELSSSAGGANHIGEDPSPSWSTRCGPPWESASQCPNQRFPDYRCPGQRLAGWTKRPLLTSPLASLADRVEVHDQLAVVFYVWSAPPERAGVGTLTDGALSANEGRAKTLATAAPQREPPLGADPDSALAGMAEPVLLDEWQCVPGVLGAVKRAVDAEHHPGSFILTGSVRNVGTWPGTGRPSRTTSPVITIRDPQQRRSPLVRRPGRSRLSAQGPPAGTL